MKRWWQSKTIWWNMLIAALAAAEANAQLLRPVLGEATFGIMLFVVTIVNVGLRFVTWETVR